MTGPPGSGKSDVVKCICYILTEHCSLSYSDILLCAPTGKAASKLKYPQHKETNDEVQVHEDGKQDCIQPLTVHGAIYGTIKKSNDNESDDDSDDEDNNMTLSNKDFGIFSHKVVIVDEVSMMDTSLCDTFLSCIDRSNTIVLLIGDHYQLPSISCGDMLRSLVSSKVIRQHIDLKEVYRYGDKMKALATSIKEGRMFPLHNSKNIQWHNLQDVNDVYQHAFDICKLNKCEEPKEKTCQVIIPTKTKEVGCDTFNEFCHDLLKPDNHKSKHPFQGELVMSTRNHKKLNVSNGDVLYHGGIGEKKDGSVTYDVFRSLKLYKEWKAESSDDKLDVNLPSGDISKCYAITIHKSQGSEWDDVVILLNRDEHKNMLNRNLLYTAVTRVKQGVLHVFYDDENVLYNCLSREFSRNSCQKDIFINTFDM
jgi:exodeoxyribonuclease V alpha subunit